MRRIDGRIGTTMQPKQIAGDNPIRRPEEDLLGRYSSAKTFADQVLSYDASSGLVVGVLGVWGSGKTSFVNLAVGRLSDKQVPVLSFNPMDVQRCRAARQLLFIELSAQLKLRPGLVAIGKELEEYGEGFSGFGVVTVVGPWIARGRGATKLFATLLQRRKEGVGARRAKLESALRALSNPILVVLDDIDRLTTAEIRDVFKLVRLTASFPNVVYLLAFDRRRVEDAARRGRNPRPGLPREDSSGWCRSALDPGSRSGQADAHGGL